MPDYYSPRPGFYQLVPEHCKGSGWNAWGGVQTAGQEIRLSSLMANDNMWFEIIPAGKINDATPSEGNEYHILDSNAGVMVCAPVPPSDTLKTACVKTKDPLCRWKFQKAGSGSGITFIQSVYEPTKCANVFGAYSEDGTRMILWPIGDHENSKFRIKAPDGTDEGDYEEAQLASATSKTAAAAAATTTTTANDTGTSGTSATGGSPFRCKNCDYTSPSPPPVEHVGSGLSNSTCPACGYQWLVFESSQPPTSSGDAQSTAPEDATAAASQPQASDLSATDQGQKYQCPTCGSYTLSTPPSDPPASGATAPTSAVAEAPAPSSAAADSEAQAPSSTAADVQVPSTTTADAGTGAADKQAPSSTATEVPTTSAPATQAPTTSAPTTKAPTSSAPTTTAPSSSGPPGQSQGGSGGGGGIGIIGFVKGQVAKATDGRIGGDARDVHDGHDDHGRGDWDGRGTGVGVGVGRGLEEHGQGDRDGRGGINVGIGRGQDQHGQGDRDGRGGINIGVGNIGHGQTPAQAPAPSRGGFTGGRK